MLERENTGAKPSLQDDRDAALLGNFGPLSESPSHCCTQPQLARFFFFHDFDPLTEKSLFVLFTQCKQAHTNKIPTLT